LRAYPDVLEIRWQIYAKEKKWKACVNIAAMMKLAPERSNGWIHRPYALHELKRTQEAFDNLLPVADQFPNLWTIPYNLACYCSQLRRFEEAQAWFKKAMAIHQHLRRRDDADFNQLCAFWQENHLQLFEHQ
jgi:tetratricopeptide (TPR) repeat protein